jgi:hypothetical protein
MVTARPANHFVAALSHDEPCEPDGDQLRRGFGTVGGGGCCPAWIRSVRIGCAGTLAVCEQVINER